MYRKHYQNGQGCLCQHLSESYRFDIRTQVKKVSCERGPTQFLEHLL